MAELVAQSILEQLQIKRQDCFDCWRKQGPGLAWVDGLHSRR
jgi:hypothetical protein